MRGNSVLEDLVVCAIALSPLRAISGDTTLLRAWLDFASCNWLMCSSKFILPGAFVYLATAAQAQAMLAGLRDDVIRQLD
jgi:hypothetical protein